MIGRIFSSKEETQEVEASGFDSYELRLGDVMRGERATIGKSLLDVQRELKIKATYIAAIENADPAAFDTPGFIAGYVRSYARYLGLDPEWAYNAFCTESNYEMAHGMSAGASSISATKAQEKSMRKPGEAHDPFLAPSVKFAPHQEAMISSFDLSAIGPMMVLVALIGGIGYGGWSVLQEVQRVQFAPVEQSPGITAEIETPTVTDTILAAADQNSGFIAPTPDALDRLYRPPSLDAPVMIARDGPISSLNPQSIGALVPNTITSTDQPFDIASGTGDIPVARVSEFERADVAIIAVYPSWTRITAADGTVLYDGTMKAGEMFVLPNTEEPPKLRTGYAGAVYLALNGETYGPLGDGASVVKRIPLGQEEIQANFAVADLNDHKELAVVVAALKTLEPETPIAPAE